MNFALFQGVCIGLYIDRIIIAITELEQKESKIGRKLITKILPTN